MFRKMLVCSDLSPASDALVCCVEELKRVGLEVVILTHVIYVANTPGMEEMLIEEAGPAIERQKQLLESQGIRVTLKMPLGLPAQTLAETADEHDVSVILIGSHGKGILQAATLGSVSSRLIHQTRRPVLLARIALLEGGKCEVVCRRMFDRVLFPTDFSRTAERALDYLGKIVLDTRCPVTIMHVLEQKDGDMADAGQIEGDARFLLEAKKRRLELLGASDVTIELVHGKPAEEIIARTNSGKYTIAVMGGHGKGVITELFLGSVANQVARQTGTPLLLIPVAD